MAGIKEIARRANTSIATVSHVLNATRAVSPELRDRVMEEIERLGYQPNMLARSLRSKRTRIIGLLISDILNPFFSELAQSVQVAAQESEYQVLLSNTFEDTRVQAENIEILKQYQVDGLIIAPAAKSSVKSIGLNSFQTPVVLVNRRLRGSVWPQIYVDNTSAARQAASHFFENGRTTIALLLTVPGVSHNNDRIRGMEKEFAEAGLTFDPDLVCYGGLTPEECTEAAEDLLLRRPDIQAFFCGSDAGLIGVFRAAEKLGRSIPEEIAVIGSGNTQWASVFKPSIAHFTQPTRDMGQRAFETLLELIEIRFSLDEWPPDEKVIEDQALATGFVPGESCGC